MNRDELVDETRSFGNLMMSINAEDYIGKEIRYSAWVKFGKNSKGTSHLWFRIDEESSTGCFFDNMNDRPITNNTWQRYEIKAKVCEEATDIVFGCMLMDKGKVYVDDVKVEYKENDKWKEITIANADFESESITEKTNWLTKGEGYTHRPSSYDAKEGAQSAVIEHVGVFTTIKGDPIFDTRPKVGERIEKEIGENIFCQIPLVLYANESITYPESKTKTILQQALNEYTEDSEKIHVRLGNVINTYNIFQHFYPYFDVVEVDWERELDKALERSFTDKNLDDHVSTLQKLTAPLKDGHIGFYTRTKKLSPPIDWEWVEGKLLITQVFERAIDLEIGQEVTKINGQSAADYFEEINSRISAGTSGSLDYKARRLSLLADEDSEMILETAEGEIKLKHSFRYRSKEIEIQKSDYKVLENDIVYMNIGTIEMDAIKKLMPTLKKSKGIICDLRGYPNNNHDFISHLLVEKDTSTYWMQVAQMIYPDQERIVGYENYGWEMEPAKPYLGDKEVVYIIDGRAISYAESYMGFIENYDLATIIGQPTAGTNGIGTSIGATLALILLFTGFVLVQSIIKKAENIADIDLVILNYETLDGDAIQLEDFAGKKILVNFWATWCAPCVAEFPLLNEVLNMVKDDFVFLMVSYESNEKLKTFVENNDYDFVFLKSNNFMLEGISTVPQSFILNAESKMVYHHPTIFDGSAVEVRDSLQNWVGME